MNKIRPSRAPSWLRGDKATKEGALSPAVRALARTQGRAFVASSLAIQWHSQKKPYLQNEAICRCGCKNAIKNGKLTTREKTLMPNEAEVCT